MKISDPELFYDRDDGLWVKNLLWIDGKSKKDYPDLNDVVYFDTRCIRKGYKMPLALFVGVDRHYQSVLMSGFEKCVYESWTDEEFCRRWSELEDGFEQEVMRSIFDERRNWVPGLIEDGWSFVGLSSSSDDEYVNRETTPQEFVRKYKEFVLSAAITDHVDMPLHSAYLEEVANVYTESLLDKLKVEVLGSTGCNVDLRNKDTDAVVRLFKVKDDGENGKEFTVRLDKERRIITSFDPNPSSYVWSVVN